MAVRYLEGLVEVEDGLDRVFAGGNLSEARGGIAENVGADRCRLTGFKALDVEAKNLGAADVPMDPKAGFACFIPADWRKDHEQPTVGGCGACFLGELDLSLIHISEPTRPY